MSNKINNRQQSGLVRALGPIDATMIVMGSMIGSGIFITSAESSRLSGAPGWLLLAWAFAGLLTITGALCCSELATMMPRAGGVYVFLREAYGPAIGFLFGWTLFLVIQTGTIAAVAIAFAKFLGVFVPAVGPENYLVRPIPLGDHYAVSLSTEQLIAIALIALLTWTNTRGLEIGKLVQNTFTFAKTAALAGVIVPHVHPRGGIRGQTGGVPKSRSLVWASLAGLRLPFFLAKRWSVRFLRKRPGPTSRLSAAKCATRGATSCAHCLPAAGSSWFCIC